MKIGGWPLSSQGRLPDTPALSGFAKGDVLQAQVVSRTGDLLTLKTQDGREVTAKVQDGTVAEEGDVLRMTVKGRLTSGELLVQVRHGAPSPHELLKLLKMEISKDTLALADACVKEGVMPTRPTLQELSALLGAHKHLTAAQALFMLQNDMPVDAQSVRAFQAFLQGQNGVGQSLVELGQMLDELLAQPTQVAQLSASAAPARTTDGAVVQSDPGGAPAAAPGAARTAQAVPMHPEISLSKLGVEAPVSAQAGQAKVVTVPSVQPPSMPTVLSEAQATAKPPVQEATPPISGPQTPQTSDTAGVRPGALPPQQEAVGYPSVRSGQTAVIQPGPPVQSGSPVQAVPDTMNPAAASAAQGSPTPLPAESAQPLTPGQVAVQAKQLLNVLFREVAARPAQVLARELTGAETVKHLAAVLSFLEKNEESLPVPARQAMARAAALVSGTLQMTEQMPAGTAVVPIPVAWQQHKTTAELFVLEDSRRKGKKIDPANATLFVSLGTQHMGRVETLVKIVGKHVECVLSSERDEAVAFLARHEADLGARLEEEGYRLVRMTAQRREKPADLLTVRQEHREKLRRARFDESV